MKEKIEIKYWVSIVLLLICIFEIIDTSISFPQNLYGIFMGQFIDIPVGIITVVFSAFIQKRETNKTRRKKYITTLGIILGIVTAALPFILYKIGTSLAGYN